MDKDKAIERTEILRNFALETTWMDLEGIILSGTQRKTNAV